MEQLKELKELQAFFKSSLNAISPTIIGELTQVLNGEAITMLPSFEKSDIATFNFEYRHEWFSMVFFGSDADGLTITEDVDLLKTGLNAYFSKSDDVMDIVSDLEDDFEGDEDDWEEMMEEYDQEKYELFDEWFEACWKEAKNQTGNHTPAYFSIDELDFGVEFITSDSVEINKDQLNIRRYTH